MSIRTFIRMFLAACDATNTLKTDIVIRVYINTKVVEIVLEGCTLSEEELRDQYDEKAAEIEKDYECDVHNAEIGAIFTGKYENEIGQTMGAIIVEVFV